MPKKPSLADMLKHSLSKAEARNGLTQLETNDTLNAEYNEVEFFTIGKMVLIRKPYSKWPFSIVSKSSLKNVLKKKAEE